MSAAKKTLQQQMHIPEIIAIVFRIHRRHYSQETEGRCQMRLNSAKSYNNFSETTGQNVIKLGHNYQAVVSGGDQNLYV